MLRTQGALTVARMRFASLLLVGLLGCGDDTSTAGGGGSHAGGGGSGAGSDGGQGGAGLSDCTSHTASAGPDFEPTEGLFTMRRETGASEFVIFSGSVHSPPSAGFQTEEAREGQCRLLTFAASICAPECDLGAFCIDGECDSDGAWDSGGGGDRRLSDRTADQQHQ